MLTAFTQSNPPLYAACMLTAPTRTRPQHLLCRPLAHSTACHVVCVLFVCFYTATICACMLTAFIQSNPPLYAACLLTAPTRTRPPHFLLELFRHDPTRHITLNLTHTHAPTHITTPQLVFCTQHNLRLFDRNYRPFKAFPSQYSSQVHYRPQLQASLHSFTLLTSSLGSLSQQVLLVVSLSPVVLTP